MKKGWSEVVLGDVATPRSEFSRLMTSLSPSGVKSDFMLRA